MTTFSESSGKLARFSFGLGTLVLDFGGSGRGCRCHLLNDIDYPDFGVRWHLVFAVMTGPARRVAVGSLKELGRFADALIAATEWTAVAARARLRVQRRDRGYCALRPGADTPLWNALAAAVQQRLRRRGEKARLARAIGVSRQRLHLLIVAKTACPDAERALLLLAWLAARRRGASRP